jgi:hypothetical protein
MPLNMNNRPVGDVMIVQSEGETRVRLMTQIQALSKLTFKATFRCNTGRLSIADKIAIHGRVLTATEAGGCSTGDTPTPGATSPRRRMRPTALPAVGAPAINAFSTNGIIRRAILELRSLTSSCA